MKTQRQGRQKKHGRKNRKKWLTNEDGGCIIFFVSGASVLRAKPNSGDLHSGSAVDSDSTCGSSILSSPTRPQPIGLRYFRGIAQLVARLVRDEEAVGSNPAAPTEKDRYTFVCRSFSISAAGFEQQQSRPPPAAETGRRGWGRVLIFQGPVKGLRKNQQTQLVRAAHLSYSFCRNVYQESTACRSTVCRTSVHAVPDRNNVRQSHS